MGKMVTVLQNGCKDIVAVDCLKLAFPPTVILAIPGLYLLSLASVTKTTMTKCFVALILYWLQSRE